MKHSDNLKIEGSHQMKRESNAVLVGERAAVVKHQDNLKMEGKMESRTQAAVVKGERAEVKRHTDNLKMEGSMQGLVSEAKNTSQAIQKVNFGKAAAKARNTTSSIVVGDDISSTTKAIGKSIFWFKISPLDVNQSAGLVHFIKSVVYFLSAS